MRNSTSFLILLFCFLATSFVQASDSLLLMSGAAAAPVIEEIARAFTQKTGIKVELSIGSSGMLLSQIKLGQKGDLYFPASSDFIEKALQEGLIVENTVRPVVYLVPAVCVARGNPKNITGLADLARPGLKIALAQPETVAVGVAGVEMIEKCLTADQKAALRKNIVAYCQNVEKTANALILNTVDAVIAWSVIENWKPEKIQALPPKPEEIVRISNLTIAVTRYAKKPELAQSFIDFMTSPEGLKYFENYKYFTSPAQAFEYVGAEKPVNGEIFKIPADWLK
ncbi:MAG: molybdate ABC transporter substrate-binding protein [Candidatus Rifleibacteriota bacterium]